MSRIGLKPIQLPQGVDIKIEDGSVSVKGAKGTLTQDIDARIVVAQADGKVTLSRASEDRSVRALHGLYRSLIANMVAGVSTGFTRTLEINGVGYRAQLAGNKLTLALGYSHPVSYDVPDGIELKVENNTILNIAGIDKQLVGQVAANIRSLRKPEPYKKKGIRYSDEVIRTKAGKSGKKK